MANHALKKDHCDIAVVGGGLVGLTTAVSLAEICRNNGWRLVLVAPESQNADNRTTALLMPSIKMIDQIGIWEQCKPHSAPLKTMRFIDGSGRLIRAPTTTFHSQEIDEEAFGYNIPNQSLLTALNRSLDTADHVERIDARVDAVTFPDNQVVQKLDNGQHLNAALVAAADGRQSPLRKAAGITCRHWHYKQTAVTVSFTHELPHHHISNEFHTETGPMTQVPLPSIKPDQFRSSLVWVVTPQRAEELISKPTGELSRLVETGLHSLFGHVDIEEDAQAYPLSGMIAERYADNRIALLGEAAHVFPPIGAQGFNLGLRDVDDFIKAVSSTDLASADAALSRYHAHRIMDARLRTTAVDLLNRSLLTNFLPVQFARASVLSVVGRSSKLRHALMRQGMGVTSLETNPVANFLSRLNRAAS